jgi:plasmid stabilization system protein ParE
MAKKGDTGKLKLLLLENARQELRDIAAIHLELVGPQSAKKITHRILDNLELLCTSPNLGFKARDTELRSLGYRILLVGNYICIYRQIGDVIYVYYIVDGRRDYPHLFVDWLAEPHRDKPD